MKSRLEDTVSLQQAFHVMQHFLRSYWARSGRPDQLGSLLGDISLLPDGGSADPAAIQDWLAAADSVVHDGVQPLKLDLRPPN